MNADNLLKQLLSGPFTHFKNVGDDDWRDPNDKNPALSLSSKGWIDHRFGGSGSLEELVSLHGITPYDNPLQVKKTMVQKIWESSTLAKPGSEERRRITDYLNRYRGIPKSSFSDLLDLDMIRWNKYKVEVMVV